MRADHLQSAFHCFRTGITKETPLQAADFCETFRKAALILVIVEVRSVKNHACLLANDLRNPRVRVAERIYADSANKIQVAVTIRIIHITAFAAPEQQRVASIILEEVLL